MKKTIIIYILLVSNLLCVGQNEEENLKKYWFYRTRLNQYFVKVGLNQGESLIASSRNTFNVKELNFSDQTMELGWYIGLLATEYKILADENQNTDNTLYELYCAYKAYERLDN
jgi:hypothetical protein